MASFKLGSSSLQPKYPVGVPFMGGGTPLKTQGNTLGNDSQIVRQLNTPHLLHELRPGTTPHPSTAQHTPTTPQHTPTPAQHSTVERTAHPTPTQTAHTAHTAHSTRSPHTQHTAQTAQAAHPHRQRTHTANTAQRTLALSVCVPVCVPVCLCVRPVCACA
jgi:hypothetical protein